MKPSRPSVTPGRKGGARRDAAERDLLCLRGANKVFPPSLEIDDCLRGYGFKKKASWDVEVETSHLDQVLIASRSTFPPLHGVYRRHVALNDSLGEGRGGVPAAFFLPSSSDFSPFCIISVSCSLSFALKSNQLPGFLFMSPGSDALASKLCKCILPVKLKPSLLVLRGLLHRVLHHSFGSGPYISHRNESADGSTSSHPISLPVSPLCLPVSPPRPIPGGPAAAAASRASIQAMRISQLSSVRRSSCSSMAEESRWELWRFPGWGF